MKNSPISEDLLNVLCGTRFMTLSTICEDGSPWATPLGLFTFDEQKRALVFDCRSGTMHAENLTRDDRCFITLVNYDDKEHRRAVYVKTFAKKLTDEEATNAKDLIHSIRQKKVANDVFMAPIGEVDTDRTVIGYDRDDIRKSYYYLKNEEMAI